MDRIPLKGGFSTEDRRLDRIPQFDERSRAFPIRTLLRADAPRRVRSYTWRCSTWLDQGREGACVGHGIAHEIAARPVVRSADSGLAFGLYRRAQQIDEWPGETYDGTSVIAGMKAAVERGFYAEYRWAFGLEDVVLALGFRGPVVLGVNWYDGMFTPAQDGFLRVTGSVAGGHCILARSVRCVFLGTGRAFADLDMDRSSVLLHNSWGPGWGEMGTARLTLRDLDLLLGQQGEACIPVTRR